MSILSDQPERDRFVQEQEKNISVIAPAGVGKTTSIVDRIARLARLPEAEAVDRLARLVVVTYSVRAAQQMQQRARLVIQDAPVSSRVRRAFQQTFFGTIHSYCVRLLDRFGHYLGLPSPVALLQEDAELWNRFLLRGLGPERGRDVALRELFHFYIPEKLYALGKEISPGEEISIEPVPALDLRKLLDYQGAGLHAATKGSIVRAQEAARQWNEAWERGERPRQLPKCPDSNKAAEFAEIWREAFAPLQNWLRDAAMAFGRRVANAYEAFRLSEAVMTYDDQVRLALRALEHPAVRLEMASERISVLLDEAQDTDPRQFEVLRRVSALGGNVGDQTFCIVGDFQQAIYAPRSDLGVYRRIHEKISTGPRGLSSRLRVTFRCDEAIIDFVNRIFPAVLNDTGGQCAFETLVARDGAGRGQVVRWVCPDLPEDPERGKITAEMRARHEARFVARRIKELGAAGLGARGWSQVAVLCPRKNWLLEIERELLELGLPVQLHSSNEKQGDRTPAAWLTALIWVAAHPEDSFEIAGVLREILGVSDSDMALHTRGVGDRLRLDRKATSGEGPVEAALNILREACAQADTQPLHHTVRQLLEKTHLRERLKFIAQIEMEDTDRELDDFLAMIATRSAEGATLSEIADELRLSLTHPDPAEEEIRDAIQLLTSHKAKGLEWQAVIVPFVFRRIETKSSPYPRLVVLERGREIVCRDKTDFELQAEDFVTQRDRQQLQRLLYVMSTRAKRTLVLIDDESLFATQKKRPGHSAGELLGFLGGENRGIWKALPEAVTLPDELPSDRAESSEFVSDFPLITLPDLSPEDVQRAVHRAGRFPRRVTPHALAIHASNEAEPEKRGEEEDNLPASSPGGPGILYGTWWHELVQNVPWGKSTEAWQGRFLEAQARSPDRARSAREWALFRGSKLARWLAEPGRLIQVELPFLWRATGEETCLEGVMDLAVYTESESAWRVIDWKTNRIGPAGANALVEIYRGQIGAYVKALREMLGVEVRGSLYLSQTGEWVEVE